MNNISKLIYYLIVVLLFLTIYLIFKRFNPPIRFISLVDESPKFHDKVESTKIFYEIAKKLKRTK